MRCVRRQVHAYSNNLSNSLWPRSRVTQNKLQVVAQFARALHSTSWLVRQELTSRQTAIESERKRS